MHLNRDAQCAATVSARLTAAYFSLFPASLYNSARCNSAPISQTATNVKDSSQGEIFNANQGGGGRAALA